MTSGVRSPHSIGEVFRWPERYLEVLTPFLQQVACETLALRPLGVTTCYSGAGMWEICLSHLAEPFGSTKLEVHSVADVNASRAVLQAHNTPARPQHVFGDIAYRWPAEIVQGLEHQMSVASQTIVAGQSGTAKRTNSGPEAVALQKVYRGLLADAEMNECGWCSVHSDFCPFLLNIKAARARDAVLLHVASPVCKDYSRANRTRKGEHGKYAVVFALWLEERRRGGCKGFRGHSAHGAGARSPKSGTAARCTSRPSCDVMGARPTGLRALLAPTVDTRTGAISKPQHQTSSCQKK